MTIIGDENAVAELAAHEDRSWLQGWFPVEPVQEQLDLILSKAAFTAAARYWRDPIHWIPGVSHTDLPWEQPRLLHTQTLQANACCARQGGRSKS